MADQEAAEAVADPAAVRAGNHPEEARSHPEALPKVQAVTATLRAPAVSLLAARSQLLQRRVPQRRVLQRRALQRKLKRQTGRPHQKAGQKLRAQVQITRATGKQQRE